MHSSNALDRGRSAHPRVRRTELNTHLALHGWISTSQLLELGFSSTSIDRLVDDELLVRLQRGIYRSSAAHVDDELALKGMLMAAGETSALARISSAHRQGHLDYPPTMPQLVVVSGAPRRKRSGFTIHKAAGLTEDDIVDVRGVRCTSAFRNVLDFAATSKTERDRRLLKRALRQATHGDRGLPEALSRHLADHRPFKGSLLLAEVLKLHSPETLIQRSGLEGRFIELCHELGIPMPQTNQLVLGHEVDLLWREQRVYGELDTYGTHGGVREFEQDRLRDAELTVAGYRGIRITAKRMDRERLVVGAQVLALLGLERR